MKNKENAILEAVNLEDVKLKLYEKLKPSGWGDKLRTFILSSDFDNILNALLKDAKNGQRFTPQLKQIFRAFEMCYYNKLSIIMIGQDPYPQKDVADGIAFSCSNTSKVEASLRYILKEVEDTVYPEGGYRWDPDLKRWSSQGILLINSALTTTITKPGTHYAIWKPFMTFLLDMLNFSNPGLIYVFLGKKASEWATSVSDNNYKFVVTHPASAAYLHMDKWDSKDLFNSINKILYKNNGQKIIW